MRDVAEFRKIFADKLKATNNMDAAFTKAVWKAYLAGIEDASKPPPAQLQLSFEIEEHGLEKPK